MIDPRAISSWGHIPGMAFAAKPGEWAVQRAANPLRLAALEGPAPTVIRPAVFEGDKNQIRPISYDVTFASALKPETTPVSHGVQFSLPCLAQMSWPQV